MEWPRHWPAWVILDLSARADSKSFLDVAVARRSLGREEGTKGQDIDSVPRTANGSISRARRVADKSGDIRIH